CTFGHGRRFTASGAADVGRSRLPEHNRKRQATALVLIGLRDSFKRSAPMDPSFLPRVDPQGSSSGSTMHRGTNDFGLISGAAGAGSSRSRMGSSHVPWWKPRRLGLLGLGVLALAWLLILSPPSELTPSSRVWGVGDATILRFAFAPDGQTIATIQT